MSVTNIVRAVVKPGTNYTITSPIMKEDKGQILLIEGLELPEVYEIDFSNDRYKGSSITMIGNADGVLIPTQFIKTGKPVYAFYYFVGDGFGQTEHIFKLPNDVRPDRTDDTPDPEEESIIDQAIGALNTAVAQTAQDVIDADASAQSASADADRAEQAKEDATVMAQRSANSAQASANYSTSAQTSAGTASAAATSASASAASAYADAERAEQAASTAGYLDVEIVDGRLIYTRTDAVDVDFTLNNGRLIMEAI